MLNDHIFSLKTCRKKISPLVFSATLQKWFEYTKEKLWQRLELQTQSGASDCVALLSA